MGSEGAGLSRAVRIGILLAAVAGAGLATLSYLRYEAAHPSTDNGYVDTNIVEIVPQVSGPIVDLAVVDNQPVKIGDLIFQIDPRRFQIAVDNARAQLDKTGQNVSAQVDAVTSAEAELEHAQAGLRLAEVQFQRVQPLAKQGALPLQDLDKAQAQLDGARAALRHAESELEKARDQLGDIGDDNADTRMAIAVLENAQLQLSYTEVRSPVNGFVTQLMLSQGSYAQAGQSSLSVVDSDAWRIVAYMREDELHGITPGQSVRIFLPAYPGVRFVGVVQGLGWGIEVQDGALGADGLPSIDQTVNWVRLAQRFAVRITLLEQDPAYPLRKGMRASIRIDKDGSERPAS